MAGPIVEPESVDAGVSAATLSQVLRRIVPFLFACYIVNYLDRVNVGLAALSMNKDIGLSPSQFGLGAGLFSIGYFVFQIPSNLILDKVGARRWLAVILVVWGIVSASTAMVTGPTSFNVARFLLGVAEGGFVPGVFFYLGEWFPNEWRARATALFLVAIPVASIVGSPISGALLTLHQIGGLRGWQWLLILEGAPAIVLGVACLFVLVDRPRDASWLDADERGRLQQRIEAERRDIERTHRYTLGETLSNGRVLTLAAINFCAILGGLGVQLWLPQIIKGFGLGNAQVGLLTAVPYVVAGVVMVLWARRSDRSAHRTRHITATMLLAAAGLVVAAFVTAPTLSLAALTLPIVGALAFQATFWAVPQTFLTGRAAAAGIALIVSVGNLGGFVGPYLIGRVVEATDSYKTALPVLAAFLLLGSLMMTVLGNPASRAARRAQPSRSRGTN